MESKYPGNKKRSLAPSLKLTNLYGTISFTVISFLPYLRLTVEIFQFLRLSTKFLAVLRLLVNPIETLIKLQITVHFTTHY